MSPYGIAASYWVLALALGVLGMLLLFLASDGIVKGKGDPPSIIMAAFFGMAGLWLLYMSLNGLWEFANGYTRTLDWLVKMWVQMARLVHIFWQALKVM